MKNNESVAEKTRKLLKLCKDTYFSGVHLVVTGHDKPDSDSLISAWLLLRLLSKKDIIAEIKFATRPDSVTAKIAQKLGILDVMNFGGFDEGDVLLLVDHHKTFYKNRVLGCIDHHTTPPEPDFNYSFVEKASSCGKMIFDMMCSIGSDDSESEIMALYSVYFDTQSCKSSKFNQNDREWIEYCIEKYSLDRDCLTEWGYCLSDPEDSVRELAMAGYKRYEFSGKAGISSCVQTNIRRSRMIEKRLPEIFEFLDDYMRVNNVFVCVYIVNNPEIGRSDMYIIKEGNVPLDERIEKISLDRLASRSVDVVPYIKRMAESESTTE